MPTLTIEAIRENPWNVMTHELPEHPSRVLLLVAQFAATCCRQIESEMIDALHDSSEQTWLRPEYSEALDQWSRAHRKIGEIIFLLSDEFGVPEHDFWMSRNTPRRIMMCEKCKAYMRRGKGFPVMRGLL